MASLSHQLSGLRWSPLASRPTQKQRRRLLPIVCSVAISSAQNKERLKLKELFEQAYERCRTAPMEGVSFTLEHFTDALEKYDFDSELGTKACSFLFFISQLFLFSLKFITNCIKLLTWSFHEIVLVDFSIGS